MTHAQSEPVEAAQMSSAEINNLPDDQFAYVEPGGSKDSEGKTVPRSLRHFPINDEAHVRNALSRAPQSPFGDKAMPKIRAACKRFGIRWSGMDGAKPYAAAADLPNVELARTGAWHLSSGPLQVTPRHLDDAARFANREGGRPAYLKIGHTDKRFAAGDGEPALGWVHNVRVEEDDRGHVLKGDLTGMPDWLAAAMPTHWPDRSIEGWEDYEHDGEKYSLVMEGLALLGVTPPGMSSIQSLRDLPAALGVAASSSGRRIVASFGNAPPPQAPAPEAEVPPTTEGAGMTLAKYREALAGLPDDASEEDVSAALTSAGFTLVAPPPENTQAQDQRVAAAAARNGGVITIDKEQLAAYEAGMVRAAALTKRLELQERDQIITAAVKAGKFPPSRKEHYEKSWDADPDGTREVIASLAPGLVPVTASGYSGDVDDDAMFDAQYGHLFPPTAARKGA